jgi:hypothetical protein
MQYERREPEYIPGTCNIGRQEVARRYRAMFAGLVISALWVLCIEWWQMHRAWKLTLFFPALLITSGFLQATHKFCLAYGWRGVFSVRGYRKAEKVTDPEFIRADRKMALMLTGQVVLAAVAITLCYYFMKDLFDGYQDAAQ